MGNMGEFLKIWAKIWEIWEIWEIWANWVPWSSELVLDWIWHKKCGIQCFGLGRGVFGSTLKKNAINELCRLVDIRKLGPRIV